VDAGQARTSRLKFVIVRGRLKFRAPTGLITFGSSWGTWIASSMHIRRFSGTCAIEDWLHAAELARALERERPPEVDPPMGVRRLLQTFVVGIRVQFGRVRLDERKAPASHAILDCVNITFSGVKMPLSCF